MGADAESFGVWLAQRMVERGLRKADLARATGVDASLIGRWMRGDSLPGLPNLRRLAPALGIAWTDLAAQAGHLDGEPGATARPVVQHPLVRDLARLLAEDSPLPDGQRETLEQVVAAVISPYRSMLRRRRRAG